MPYVNFDEIDDMNSFEPLPNGKYQARLVDVDETTTKNGDPMWKLKFEVISGEHSGWFIFDNLVFTKNAMSRVKLLCKCMGLDTAGELDLQLSMLLDKTVTVRVYTEEYEDFEGYTKTTNRVPFNGYEFPMPEASAHAAVSS